MSHLDALALPQGFWRDSVDSTQEEAKRLIQSGEIQGAAFVVAHHQTQGKGTQGRKWTSPAGAGIYLSIVHIAPAEEPYTTTHLYTLAAGVACVEALATVLPIAVQIKPVNDLYVQGKKLGGILVESELNPKGLTTLITGIGINTHRHPRNLDRPQIEPVSIQEILTPEAFERVNTEDLVEAVVGKICFYYALIWSGQAGQVERKWQTYQTKTLEVDIINP